MISTKPKNELDECGARALLCDIKKVLIYHGIWFTVVERMEPDLKGFEIKASIRVKR